MGQKLSPEHHALYQAIDEIVWSDWDPIGVSQLDGSPRDEYYGYLPRIFTLSLQADRDVIADYLQQVSDQRMGCPMRRDLHLAVADKILEAHEHQSVAPRNRCNAYPSRRSVVASASH